jgi:tetratricopeptide (TPR) repeat protein
MAGRVSVRVCPHMDDRIEELVQEARTHIDASRFADAQSILVAAGRLAPREGEIYRWLGETLLRRGDAERAERVLQRAVELGASEDAQLWLERARVFRPMQTSGGMRVVALEVARSTAPPRELLDSMSETTTDVHMPRPGRTAPRPAPLPSFHADDSGAAETAVAPAPRRASTPAPAPARTSTPAPTAARTPAPARASIPAPARAPAPAPAPAFARAPTPAPAFARAPTPAPAVSSTPAAAPLPYSRDVMDALAFAGLFEPPLSGSADPAAWDAAVKGPKRKGGPLLIGGMVLFLGAATGTYFFYQHKRAGEHVQAEAILATVETQIHAGKPDSFSGIEADLGRAFTLETRSPRAALDWARERAMVGLVKSGADVAFEDAMTRAKDLGIADEKTAFARVASFLFQGDIAGAAAVLPRWDAAAASDAWYQLVAGAVMERAGDQRSRDRYAAAAKLDPDLVVARVALVRVTAFVEAEGPAAGGAMRMAKELRASLPDRAEPVALVALAWGLDPRREEPAPPEVDAVATRADELPSGLRFVPYATKALRAIGKHARDEARSALAMGLGAVETPASAVWLGTIALELGDESLARKAALAAVQFSAAFEPARALAARVALLGGRLDEALKATEDLEASSPDVAVVRAATAYERVDPDGVARALEALSPQARSLSFVSAFALAGELLAGKTADASKLAAATGADAPWSDLVAMDSALDSGDLTAADKLALAWGAAAELQPLRAVRLARLARYEGRLEAAETLSTTALQQGTVTPRVLWERAFTLVARSRSSDVGPLLARYPLVLGPLATWLSAYATASSGAVDAASAAKGKTSSIDPPPSTAPLESRVVAAAALGAMKDKKRGSDYVKEILATGSLHPDLVAAALALGFTRVEHGKRRPTYE